jgi:hypothetical protein
MSEVTNTQAVETISQPSFNRSTKAQRDDFRHILLLLRLVTAYNYGDSMLPNQAYANQFSEAADKKYRDFTPEGVLNALATVFVTDNEVIATSALPSPGSTNVIAAVTSARIARIRNVAVVPNGKIAEDTDKDACADVEGAVEPLSLEQDMLVESFYEAT